ncbi:MAG: hypothetical protein ACK5JD_01650 [Mangrovibacterium sp.]
MIDIELNKKLLLVFRIDSLYGVLTSGEKVYLRACFLGRRWGYIPERVKFLLNWSQLELLNLPELRVGQDRLVYVLDRSGMVPIEKYRAQNRYMERRIRTVLTGINPQ